MEESDKALAEGVTRTACFVLIGCLAVTLLIFAIFRIMNHGRFIHMNIEFSLLCAHLCLLPNFVGDEVSIFTVLYTCYLNLLYDYEKYIYILKIPNYWFSQDWCRNISIFIHFFFTVVFAFFMLEGIYMYSLLANVVTKNGMLSYMGNFLCGWGIGICVIAFSVSFEFEDYGGDYR